MKKTISIFLIFLSASVYSQNHNLVSQYFQVMPFYAPGLTGANGFLDVRTGLRKQWVNFDGAPFSYFLGGSGIVTLGDRNLNKHNSVKVGNENPYNMKTTKFGLGGYIFNERIGEFEQLGTMLSSAVHVSIATDTYISLGFTSGYHYAKLDENNLWVLNPTNDLLYQDYQQNGGDQSYFKLNSGLAVYSPQYYFSYSIINLINSQLGGNQIYSEGRSEKVHTFIGGYRLSPWPKYELIPAAYMRFANNGPLLFDIGARIRYQQKIYAGLSYRNDETIIGIIGFTLSENYNLSYSFERKNTDFAGFSPLSHELVIGVKLFNTKNYTSLW